MASSLMGASSTLPGNSWARFFVALNAPPKAPDVLAVDIDSGIVGEGLGLGFPDGLGDR